MEIFSETKAIWTGRHYPPRTEPENINDKHGLAKLFGNNTHQIQEIQA
jgi:hypothetical protein